MEGVPRTLPQCAGDLLERAGAMPVVTDLNHGADQPWVHLQPLAAGAFTHQPQHGPEQDGAPDREADVGRVVLPRDAVEALARIRAKDVQEAMQAALEVRALLQAETRHGVSVALAIRRAVGFGESGGPKFSQV